MLSGLDKSYSCNTLIGIVKACAGKRIQIDLRNEMHICGQVDSVFADMNVVLMDAYLIMPSKKYGQSNSKHYEQITVRGRNIRFVHVPDDVDMITALQNEIMAVRRKKFAKFSASRKPKQILPIRK